MNYSAIIFDLDGTLLNTIDDLANSMNHVLKNHGLPIYPADDYKLMVGNGMENLVRKALSSTNSDFLSPSDSDLLSSNISIADERFITSTDERFVTSFLDEFQKKYNESWHDVTKPYPGIEELLESLKTMGIRMSVLSNKADHFTQAIIDYFFGLNHFDFVYGARVDVPKKPDPAGALEIALKSNILTGSFLYLGDSGVDMLTANAAGMFALGATWGFRKIEELKANGVKRLINNPVEIIEIIKNSVH